MLIHSRIYYEMDLNIIDDHTWSKWAMELADLQEKYPRESSEVIWADAFKGWDGSSGAFLPLKDPWVETKANYIASICGILPTVKEVKIKKQKPVKKSQSRRLF